MKRSAAKVVLVTLASLNLVGCETPGEREYNLALAEGTKAALKSSAEYHDLAHIQCEDCKGLSVTIGNPGKQVALGGYQLSNKGADALTSLFAFGTTVLAPLTTGKGMSFVLREVNELARTTRPATPSITNVDNSISQTDIDNSIRTFDDHSVFTDDHSIFTDDHSIRNDDHSVRPVLTP